MASAQDYPITTPYGQVAGYPLNNGFHNGIDYGCPTGTPVVVNGVTIGLSGATGYATGPHLHVGRWVGGTVTNPVGGFQFNSAIVTQVASDATNGNYVRIQADGASWVYLHLSKQLVSVGQVLQGGNVADKISLATARILAEDILGRDRGSTHAGTGDSDLNANHVGKDLTNSYIMYLWQSPEASAAVNYRTATQNFYNTYKDKIAELSARPTKEQLAQLGKDLEAEHQKVAAAEAKLAEEQAKKSEDTVLLDEAGNWFTKLFNRLFKKG